MEFHQFAFKLIDKTERGIKKTANLSSYFTHAFCNEFTCETINQHEVDRSVKEREPGILGSRLHCMLYNYWLYSQLEAKSKGYKHSLIIY